MLRRVGTLIRETRTSYPNNNVMYLCDPVMGDHGKLYVQPEMVDIYRDEVRNDENRVGLFSRHC